MELMQLAPKEIEKRSFEIIGEELDAAGIVIPEDVAFIVKRAIHTTADLDYARSLYFSKDAVDKALSLMEGGAAIVTDTNMALSGINKRALLRLGIDAVCHMSDPDIVRLSEEKNVTRAALSMEKATEHDGPVIFVIGNAPTALIRLREMYDEGRYTPAFVIGVPVGFVNVEAAKEMIIETDLPCIVNRGRKGGSNVAAALVNALLYKAAGRE